MNYTEQQQRAIQSLEPRICVDAGAGSGKTRVLIDRIVYLLEQGHASLDNIVAITFTDKAAGEMKQRLRQAFRKHASEAQEDPERMSRWRDLERQVEYARISTIHSFCTGILRENALRLGMHPDFSVLAEAETTLMRDEIVSGTLQELIEKRDADLFAAATTHAAHQVEQGMHWLLKHRARLHRVAEHWPLEDATALLSRWSTALREEHERALLALKHSPEVVHFLQQIQLLDGKCLNPEDPRERRRLKDREGFRALQQAQSPHEARQALSTIREKHVGRASGKNWTSDDRMKELSKLQDKIVEWAEKFLDVEESSDHVEEQCADLTCAMYRIFKHVDTAYTEAKRLAAAYDFDDLIELGVHALREHPAICARVARGIHHLLVDEFQDTDGTQAEMMRLLFNHPEGPNIFVVGDAKQSIYYFRGAEVEVFDEIRQETPQLLKLDRNFRSLPGVLEFVNAFFAETRLLSRVGEYEPMQVDRASTPHPGIEFLLEPPGPELNADAYRRHEAELIAARIQELCTGPHPLQVLDGRPAAYGDFALLFRAMGDVYLYEEALRRARIPYMLVRGRGFYRKQEVLDLLNCLKVIVDSWNESALLAFLRGPLACLSDDTLYWMTRNRTPLPRAFESDTLPPGVQQSERLNAARGLIREARQKKDLPLPEYLQWLLDKTGLEAIVLAQYHGIQHASNLHKLLELAADFARRRPPSLFAFVRYLEDVGKDEEGREGEAAVQAEGAGAVSLMSIHQSKGLEFPVVFLPDMGRGKSGSGAGSLLLHRELGMAMRGIDPTGATCHPAMYRAIKRRIEEEEQAESTRVLYVAMTRAKDHLVLCGNCQKSDKTWMGVLNRAYGLLEKPHGDALGGPNWSGKITREAARPVAAEQRSAQEALDIDRMLRQTVSVALPPRDTLSISQLLDLMTGALPGAEDHTPEPGRWEEIAGSGSRAEAVTRGSAVHRLFERWDFQQDAPPDLDELLEVSGGALDQREALRASLEKSIASLRALPLYQTLRATRRIDRELPFVWRHNGIQISGVIDALLDGDILLDYKTGRHTPECCQRYTCQLLLYALATRQLTGHAPSRGLLFFTDAQRVEEVPITGTCLRECEIALDKALEAARTLPGAMAS